jgi:hypothetical protein
MTTESDDFMDKRPLTVNGKKYYTMTANKCTTCAAQDRFMFVKQKLAGGDVVLECSICESYITIRAEMVNMNLNKG